MLRDPYPAASAGLARLVSSKLRISCLRVRVRVRVRRFCYYFVFFVFLGFSVGVVSVRVRSGSIFSYAWQLLTK